MSSSSAAVDESCQLLVVALDINPNQLLFARQPGSFSKIMNCILTFMNSHLMLHSTNRVALVAAHATGCSYLYPDPSDQHELLRQQDGQHEEFYLVETVVRRRAAAVLGRDMGRGGAAAGGGLVRGGGAGGAESLLSGALAMSLAYINRVKASLGPAEKICPRLFVVSSSGDSACQYMNYMNAFFTAQKLNIPLDCCMVMQDSSLLQQGCDITGGVYLKVDQLAGLLQYLIWVFLPAPPLRKMLGAPPPVKVDYRAACFCHRQLVDVGYVCSVCLSIFCKFNPVCTTCHSVFQTPSLPLAKKKKDAAAAKKT